MNRLPNIDMPEETSNNEIKSINNLEEDLKIIGEGEVIVEDLKSDPFIRPGPFIKAVPIKPAPEKKKKDTSQKQKAHLANARKLAKEKKEKLKKQKELASVIEPVQPPIVQPVAVAVQEPVPVPATQVDDDADEYMRWMDKMEKYKRMTALLEKQELEKQQLVLKKEQELEAKYFAKFKKNQQILKLQQAEKSQPTVMPTILEKQETFGEFSNYF
tara:strand:+ start:2199 stop:2843 length:645 start_codon:yes stop_codon:yes gene_type:complete